MQIEHLTLTWIDNDSALWQEIVTFVKAHDAEFVPPISQRMAISTYVEQFRQPDGRMIVALDSGNIAGCMGSFIRHPERGTPFLQYGAVAHEFRQSGLATVLMQKSVDMLAEHGFSWVEARTWSKNRASQRLFESQGFVIIDRVSNDRGPGVDTLIYGKAL